MNLNYKKILMIHIFLDCVCFGLILRHDSYHIFLAIASVILAYSIVCFLISSKPWTIICFVLIAVTICQLSVTVKKTLVDRDFQQQLGVNPTGVLVADVLHGFKRIAGCPGEAKNAFLQARSGNAYTLLENMNYRYLTMGLLMPIMVVFLLFRETQKESIPSRKSKK